MHPPAVVGRVETVFVAAGASETADVARRIAVELAALLPTSNIRVAVGASNTSNLPAGVEAVVTSGGLLDELAAADLVVTAGGVTMLESLALGRPTVAFVLADNQRQ